MEYIINGLIGFTVLFVVFGFILIAFILVKFALEVVKFPHKKCEWSAPKNLFDSEYKTQCGSIFHDATESGDPVTDWIKFCPYCSKSVKIEE